MLQLRYRYPLLSESSHYSTSLLQKTNISTRVANWKESKGFLLLWRKWKQWFCTEAAHNIEQQEGHHHAPFPWATLSISASSHHSFELCLWGSVLFDLFWASVSKMCPKGSEKPRRVFFCWVFQYSKTFPDKWMAIASLFYAIWLRKGFIGMLYFQVMGKPVIEGVNWGDRVRVVRSLWDVWNWCNRCVWVMKRSDYSQRRGWLRSSEAKKRSTEFWRDHIPGFESTKNVTGVALVKGALS